MDCAVAFEGFYVSRQYIVKEMTIYFDKDNYQHFMFNNPDHLEFSTVPSHVFDRTVKYAQRLNGLSPGNDYFLPYSVIGTIVAKIKNNKIYTAGNQATKVLRRYLVDAEIVDICDAFHFKYPRELPPVPCFKRHPPRYCSLAKSIIIKNTVDKMCQDLL